MDAGLSTLRKGRKHGVPTPLSDAVAIAAILASLLVVVAGVCIYRRWSRNRSKRAPRFKHRNSDAVPLRTVLDSPGSGLQTCLGLSRSLKSRVGRATTNFVNSKEEHL